MNTEKPTYLLTGSEGIIGTVVRKKLSDKYNFIGVDITPQSDDDDHFQADISNMRELEDVYEQCRTLVPAFLGILHLAGDSRANAPYQSVLRANVGGTYNIYEFARKHGIPSVVLASSNRVTQGYEELAHPPLHMQIRPRKISPSEPVTPVNAYGLSKVQIEQTAELFNRRNGIGSVILRIGTVLKDNIPLDRRHLRTLLTHDDTAHLIDASLMKLLADPSFFGTYYGVSKNTNAFWSIRNAQKDLGYNPQQNAWNLVNDETRARLPVGSA